MTDSLIESNIGPVPSRLKCSICSKLARDPFRLPCCEKSVCSSCRDGLPKTCPLCEYHPLHPDDCSENVPLRKTIQVFLRHAEQKSHMPSENPSSTNQPSPNQSLQKQVYGGVLGGEGSYDKGTKGISGNDVVSGQFADGQVGSNQWSSITPMLNPMGSPSTQSPVNNRDTEAFGMNPYHAQQQEQQQQFMMLQQQQQQQQQQQMMMMQQQAMFGFDPMMAMMMGFDTFDGGFDPGFDEGFQAPYRRGGYRGRGRGRGGYDYRPPSDAIGNVPSPVVPGAPSAPKAMLIARGRGRGLPRGGMLPQPEKHETTDGPVLDKNRGRKRSRSPQPSHQSDSRSISRSDLSSRSRSPRRHETDDSPKRGRSPSNSHTPSRSPERESRNRSQSPSYTTRSEGSTRSPTPQPKKLKHSSRSERDESERQRSRHTSSKHRSRHSHRRHRKESSGSSKSTSHHRRHHSKSADRHKRHHDTKSKRHSSSRHRDVTPTEHTLPPEPEHRESAAEGKETELYVTNDRESRSPSPYTSRRSSRSKHSHRKRHRSESRRGYDASRDEEHYSSRSSRHNDQSVQNTDERGDRDGDTRRRNIRYEDEIETTALQAEREREQERWR